VSLHFEDGEFDLVTSNFVFHSIKMVNRISLIREALRVLQDGGVFAFQDLFNIQFYGDIDIFYKELQSWGLTKLNLVNTSEFVYIPMAFRTSHMVGNSKILYGIK